MYYLGIDLGGTNIAVGVVDKEGNIVGRGKKKTNLPRPAQEIVKDMVEACKLAVEDAKITMKDIECAGVGTPGTANRETGIVEFSNNLGFENVPLVQMLEEGLGVKVFIENDANAAAYGEFIAGSAKGAKNAVVITLGTGVGGGIIINSKIYCGSNFAGAEIGHMVTVCDGVPCNCGRNGCYESYASATALIRQTKEAMENDKSSVMWEIAEHDINKVNGRTAFDGMRAGDAAAKKVVDTYINYIGCGLVNIINIFQPDVLSIGGGICNEGETLLKPIREYVERERYSRYSKKQTKICTASLGNDAGIIGAAFLKDA